MNLQNYDICTKGKTKCPPGQGSNNWAVSGEKTQSGFPIL
ncbi:MAG: penicillin acylase family protein [Saprospiraceae bacterium]|nr:penicillin acylase family protein [Saprospiraceae bacterium]